MGNLFVTIFGGLDPLMNTDLDFSPGATLRKAEGDDEILDRIEAINIRANAALVSIRDYIGCASIIRSALGDSKNNELQVSCFEGVSPNIKEISGFYNLSVDIGREVGVLSRRLLGEGRVFEEHAAVAKALGDLLLFCFEFDQLKVTPSPIKMMKPELQNDFSFYRRSLGSKAIEPLPKPILADSAQVISMWIAQNLPMMSAIADIDPLPLAALANVCCGMVIRQVCGENRAHVLKVMTAAVIAYDRIAPTGAFIPVSPIKMRKVVTAVARYGGQDLELLQNSLKFSTLHYKDDVTPTYIKAALGN